MNQSQEEIRIAREQFQKTGTIPDGANIRPEILQSWKRSWAHKVTKETADKSIISNEAVLARIANCKNFFDTAYIFMQNLYTFTTDSGFITAIFDTDGYILSTFGDATTLAAAEENALVTGCNRSEENLGTNGIGSALTHGAPIQVIGEEHYFPVHYEWICSGAPVYDDKGELAGGICIIGYCENASFHTLGMVSAAAQAITQQLVMQKAYDTVMRIQENLDMIVTAYPTGILLLDHAHTIVMANPGATKLLHMRNDELVGLTFENLLTDVDANTLLHRGVTDRMVTFSYCGVHANCAVSVQMTPSGEFVILFEKAEQLHRRANKVAGSNARFTFSDIIGKSPQLKKAIELGRLASCNQSHILLKGESGTGKELFAQSIHNASNRSDGPFIAINCGAIPKSLIESELFGYEGGSFTGAKRDGCPGKFELANGGTIFLDEIGDMPFDVQATLLRVLQNREVSRIGSTKTIKIDVRIISATHQDLILAIKNNTFRNDLYYRLNVFDIHLPALRQRSGDIQVLAQFFLSKYTKDLSGGIPSSFTPEALRCLNQYAWPGNVRELENAIERSVYLAQGAVIHEDCFNLMPNPTTAQAQTTIDVAFTEIDRGVYGNGADHEGVTPMKTVEKLQIESALRNNKYNVTKAAQQLGISRRTIYRKIKQYNIDF